MLRDARLANLATLHPMMGVLNVLGVLWELIRSLLKNLHVCLAKWVSITPSRGQHNVCNVHHLSAHSAARRPDLSASVLKAHASAMASASMSCAVGTFHVQVDTLK